MEFGDIFKREFLTKIQSVQTIDIAMALLVSIVVGAYIFWFYKKTYKGVMFSKMFAVALTGMTVITTFIILAVTSNVVLSLGMVGALSIVRFRSAIKEPVDIIYIFWAISEGIAIGAKQYVLVFIGTICISVAMATFGTYKEKLNRYILVVRHKGNQKEIVKKVKANSKKMEIKSNTLYETNERELIIELVLAKEENELIDELNELGTVHMASLVKYNGEYIIE